MDICAKFEENPSKRSWDIVFTRGMYVRRFSSSEANGGIVALRFNLIGQKEIKMAPQCFSPTSHFKNLLKRVTCSTKISVQSEDSVSSLMWLLQIRLCTDFFSVAGYAGGQIADYTLWDTLSDIQTDGDPHGEVFQKQRSPQDKWWWRQMGEFQTHVLLI